MISHKKRGVKSFLKRDFKSASIHFSLALQEDLEDEELMAYLDLTELAKVKEEEAYALFEFYHTNAKENNEPDLQGLKKTIDSLQAGLEKIKSVFENREIENILMQESGIIYEDFLDIVKKRGSFTRTFEDIMFSTRVLISKKEDFIHFLNLLVDNGFTDMALNYLESAVSIYPTDATLRDVANKLKAQSQK